MVNFIYKACSATRKMSVKALKRRLKLILTRTENGKFQG